MMKRFALITSIILIGLFEFNRTAAAYEYVDEEKYSEIVPLDSGDQLYEGSLLDGVIDFEPYYNNVSDWYSNDGKIESPTLHDKELWNVTGAYRERCRLAAIPQKIIDECNTEELLELVLQCQLNYIVRMHGEFEEGMLIYYNSYNGLRELMDREDGGEVVLRYYEKYQIPEEKEFDYSVVQDSMSIEEFNDKADEILQNNEYVQQISNDSKVKYIVNLCEWILAQKEINSEFSETLAQRTVAVVAEKNQEIKDTDFACNTENYFVNSLIDESDNMEVYAPYVSRAEAKTIKTIKSPGGNTVVLEKYNNPTTGSYEKSLEDLGSLKSKNGTCVLLIGLQTSEYNCHSFAWFTMMPGYIKYAKSYQLNDPTPLMEDPKAHKLKKPVEKCVISYGKSHSMYVTSTNYTCNECRIYNEVRVAEKYAPGGALIKWPLKYSLGYNTYGNKCEYYIFYK